MSEGLDAVLNGDGTDVPVEVESEPEAVEAEPEAAAEEPEQKEESHTVPVAAIQDERAKRQALEEQVNALQAQLDATTQPVRPEATPEPLVPDGLDFYGEPEKALSAVAENLTNRFQSQLQEVQEANRLQLSEAVARAKYTDFEDNVESFRAEARKDPTLIAQANAHPDPAEFIYKTGQRAKELAPFDGDLNKLKEQIIADYKKQLEAEASKQQRQKVPKSLTKDGGADGGHTPAGPESLGDILGR